VPTKHGNQPNLRQRIEDKIRHANITTRHHRLNGRPHLLQKVRGISCS
jgi:hypothetical protein